MMRIFSYKFMFKYFLSFVFSLCFFSQFFVAFSLLRLTFFQSTVSEWLYAVELASLNSV